MKNIAREKVLFLLIFILMVVMVVNAGQKQKKYYVFNASSGKMYRYHKLKPVRNISGNQLLLTVSLL